MRNGDVYKIERMALKDGYTTKQITDHFKWTYPAEEVKKFIPKTARAKKQAESED